MTHLISGNKFGPNKDIPDFSGKVGQLTPRNKHQIPSQVLQHNADYMKQRYTSSLVAQQESVSRSQPIFSKFLLLSQKEEHADEATEVLKKYADTGNVHRAQCDLKDLKKDGPSCKAVDGRETD